MRTTNLKKRLSQFKKLMLKFEAILNDMNIMKRNPTVTEASQMYTQALPHFGLPEQTAKNRHRRIGQTSWRTAGGLI